MLHHECFSQLRELQFYIWDTALDSKKREALLFQAQTLFKNNQFTPAKVGKGVQKKRVKSIRGDMIHWIEDWSHPSLIDLKNIFEEILQNAKRELFLPLKRFESHLTYYPSGTHYLRHVDRHQKNPSRLLTAVLYLGDWHEGNGGELILYKTDQLSAWESQTPHPSEIKKVVISPLPGRMVLFDSTLVHEVKTTHVPRWSLTTWFRDDIHTALKL